jgi:hypothetical protein
MRSPNARCAYTRNPPVTGIIAASSATATAPISEYTPPMAQKTMMSVGSPTAAATVPGRRRIPTPTIVPNTIATPKPSPRIRRNGRVLWIVVAISAVCLRLQVGGRFALWLPIAQRLRSSSQREMRKTG